MSDSTELQIVIDAKDLASKTLGGIADNMEAAFKKASNAAKIAGTAILGFGLLSVKHFADVGEEVSNMAIKTGLSTEAVSALRVAADQTGVSLGSVESSIKKMQVGMTSAEGASDNLKAAFSSMGSDINDLFAKGTTPAIQFELLGAAIGGVQDPATRTQLAIEAFGKAGTDLLPLFESGKFSMAEWSDQAKVLGLSFDEQKIAMAKLADEGFDKLKSSMEGITNTVGAVLAPQLADLLTKIQPIITSVIDWIGKNPELSAQLFIVITALTGLVAIAPFIVASFTAVAAVFTFLAANPITLVVAAIVGLIAAIVLMIYNWDLVQLKIQTVWNNIVGFLQAVLNTIVIFLEAKMEAIKTGVSNAMGLLSGAWSGFWQNMADTVNSVVGGIISTIADLIGKVQAAIEAVKNFAASTVQRASSGFVSPGSNVKKRARGGALNAGDVTMVGEEGAEMFVPNVHGSIIPSSRVSGGSNIIVNISGNTLLDNQAAEKMGDLIISRLRFNHRLA